MRVVVLLLVAVFAVFGLGCNSEATVCPNPGVCGTTPVADADADVLPDAAAETDGD